MILTKFRCDETNILLTEANKTAFSFKIRSIARNVPVEVHTAAAMKITVFKRHQTIRRHIPKTGTG